MKTMRRLTTIRARRCVLLAAILVAACTSSTDRITGVPGRTGVAGQSGVVTPNVLDDVLLGRWSRTTIYDDNSGFIHQSQLVWEFRADGGAQRTIVTTNISLGLVATEIIPATWRTNAHVVEITLLPPGSGTLRFNYAVGLSTLILGPFTLERIP